MARKRLLSKLSDKHYFFVKEYCKDRNATRAYIAAGYGAKNANGSASRLLANVKIRTAIDQELSRIAVKYEITAERTIKHIADFAYGIDAGCPRSIRMKALDTLAKHFKLVTDKVELAGVDGDAIRFVALPSNGTESPDHPSPANPIPEPSLPKTGGDAS